ncbi:hypothetical protein F0562_004373 [Nyssa sinensis]|uniref:Glycosyltransferase n=1 Tax=Nyssa sinensis TaxID=561372 RepID=A0A5J5BZ61_9ASTE|nr:hypothetical protein F0562_004373 [Nyssa sinensis]
MKGWVSQEEILTHPAIGGFVSHYGWNSVKEAAQQGVPATREPEDKCRGGGEGGIGNTGTEVSKHKTKFEVGKFTLHHFCILKIQMMPNTSSIKAESPHIVFFPSPGMGHLTPFLRLAAMLASRNCSITLIATQTTVCPADFSEISSFFSSHPEIKRLEFQINQRNTSNSTTDDPFINQFEIINCSVQLLPPLLSSLPQPVSAIFSDFVVAASLTQIAADLGIPHYIVSTTSARCYSTIAYLPVLMSETPAKFSGSSRDIEIPGLAPLPKSIIPPSWLDDLPSNHLLTAYLIPNARSLPKVKGILLNSFNWFEPETIAALMDGRVLSNLPPVFPVGPLQPYKLKNGHHIPWLDDQPAESVVYVSFGSRTAMSNDQIREIGIGLEQSGFAFLWVLKSSKVDENETRELQELLGDSFLESTKKKGMVVRGLVNQEAILAHSAIGGFVNHCEWDSVMEAARQGVPMLAWPQHGDQKMSSEVIENAGLGMWAKDWGWGGESLVKGKEIGERVRELMGNGILRVKAKKVGEEARKAYEFGGSSEKVLMGITEMLKQKDSH